METQMDHRHLEILAIRLVGTGVHGGRHAGYRWKDEAEENVTMMENFLRGN